MKIGLQIATLSLLILGGAPASADERHERVLELYVDSMAYPQDFKRSDLMDYVDDEKILACLKRTGSELLAMGPRGCDLPFCRPEDQAADPVVHMLIWLASLQYFLDRKTNEWCGTRSGEIACLTENQAGRNYSEVMEANSDNMMPYIYWP